MIVARKPTLVDCEDFLRSRIKPSATLVSAYNQEVAELARKLGVSYIAADLVGDGLFYRKYDRFVNPVVVARIPLESWERGAYAEDSTCERRVMHNLRRLFNYGEADAVLWPYIVPDSFSDRGQVALLQGALRTYGIRAESLPINIEADEPTYLWIPRHATL